MGFLDWMKNKQEQKAKTVEPEGIGRRHTPSFERAAAEWKQDTEIAKERNETGKEPEYRPLDVKPIERKERPKVKVRSRDIPF
jgi:hypothetical protein